MVKTIVTFFRETDARLFITNHNTVSTDIESDFVKTASPAEADLSVVDDNASFLGSTEKQTENTTTVDNLPDVRSPSTKSYVPLL